MDNVTSFAEFQHRQTARDKAGERAFRKYLNKKHPPPKKTLEDYARRIDPQRIANKIVPPDGPEAA